jgi:hypothetical protein
MATANVRNIIRAKGRLCYGATNLTTAFPHGGTALGLCRDMVFHFGMKTALNTAEEWGGVVSKVYYTGERPFLAAVLREMDNDAITAIFPNTTLGTVNQDRYINFVPGVDASNNRPGYDLTGKNVKLVFSPIAVERHPFIIIYYAIPAVDEAAEMQLSMRDEVGIAVAFWAGVDSSDRCYRIGRRDDLNPVL